MKVLIWVLTIIIGTAINVLIGEVTGVRLGAFLLYIVEAAIARKLCQRWDEKHIPKTEYKVLSVNVDSLERDSSQQCDETGTGSDYEPEDEEEITNSVEPCIKEEYQRIPIRFCRYCGSELIDESKFCSNCGERIAD